MMKNALDHWEPSWRSLPDRPRPAAGLCVRLHCCWLASSLAQFCELGNFSPNSLAFPDHFASDSRSRARPKLGAPNGRTDRQTDGRTREGNSACYTNGTFNTWPAARRTDNAARLARLRSLSRGPANWRLFIWLSRAATQLTSLSSSIFLSLSLSASRTPR